MAIPIYIRRTGPSEQKESAAAKIKLHCLAELIQETRDHVRFQTQQYLSVDLHSHYYVKLKSPTGMLELWLVQFAPSAEMQSPYTYEGAFVEKHRDVPANWVEDE